MHPIFKIAGISLVAATLSHAWGDCTEKRFSREMEFSLMTECIASANHMGQKSYEQKVEACACLVGSLACKYDGDDKKLNEAAEKGSLEKDEKKYQKCLEKKGEVSSSGKLLKALVKVALEVANEKLNE